MARKIKPLTAEEKRRCDFLFSSGGKIVSVGECPLNKN